MKSLFGFYLAVVGYDTDRLEIPAAFLMKTEAVVTAQTTATFSTTIKCNNNPTIQLT
jgi:hypothetical protein